MVCGNSGLSQAPTNTVWRYNIIHDNDTGGFDAQVPGCSNPTSQWLYGNIFYNNSPVAIDIEGFDFGGSVFYVYNNTVYGVNGEDGLRLSASLNPSSNMSYVVKNNIFNVNGYPLKDWLGYLEAYGTHSNNLFNNSLGGTCTIIYGPGGANNTCAYYKTNYESSAQVGDPTFTGGTLPTGFSGTYGTNMVPNTTYFSISTGDAIGNGATLGSPYNSAINYAGVATPLTRPAGAYDIGAYQYTGVGAYPASSGGRFIGGLLIQ